MSRIFSIACVFALAVAAVVGQASANVILQARGPGGSNNVTLAPNQTVTLTISLVAQSAPTTYAGGDFRINSGSTATFHGTQYLLSGAGLWTSSPPAGTTARFFTGGPLGTHTFSTVGSTLDLGTIVMQAGNVLATFSTNFTSVTQLDGSFQSLPVTLSGFTYTVAIPEPSSMMLLGVAAGGMVLRRRRR
ncbi:MAG: PEP-CTERM sorting domain-containing protein [Pirellulaceae bacterium]|nr:PEP-CTERM sorting domain-containing protein [Pirellulaceae bacterium]